MIVIDFQYDSSLDNIDERLKVAIGRKLTELTQVLYDKVIENVSGKILQKQSGQLAGSIAQEVDAAGEPMIGTVFVEPATPKAWALERGGEKHYIIEPVKSQVLRWYSKDGALRFAQSVLHPPSKEFAYLRLALEDMQSLMPDGFKEAIEQAWGE